MSELSGQSSNFQQIRSVGLGVHSAPNRETAAFGQEAGPVSQAQRRASDPMAGTQYMANFNKYLISRNAPSLRIRPEVAKAAPKRA